jgi:hypothetical protein
MSIAAFFHDADGQDNFSIRASSLTSDSRDPASYSGTDPDTEGTLPAVNREGCRRYPSRVRT